MFNRRRTIDELEGMTGVSWSSCQRILTEELHMKRPSLWRSGEWILHHDNAQNRDILFVVSLNNIGLKKHSKLSVH
jgi:hypothetical protein